MKSKQCCKTKEQNQSQLSCERDNWEGRWDQRNAGERQRRTAREQV